MKGFVLYPIVLVGAIASSASGGYLQDKLIASDGQANDHFGRSVSLSSNTCVVGAFADDDDTCLLYTSPSPRDRQKSRMPSSA